MVAHTYRRQDGYTLILLLLVLMGIGGVVASGYTQDAKQAVEKEKMLHNKRVLAEAKRALLQYAYNYPVISGNIQGPGRLPCVDVDNDGSADTAFGTCDSLGRLPWNEAAMSLYDIRDADGQRLWYAVSTNFATNVPGGNTVNSDPLVTFGTITVRDQMTNIIYDGSTGGGVAAVIIAPGPETARNGVPQDRGVGNGDDPFDATADTDPGIVNAANYLDAYFGIEDNSTFGQSTTNGFILGRVDELGQSSVLVNDQIAIITAEEMIEVAEKAALQAYQEALNDYNDLMTLLGADTYPWLDSYATTNLATYEGEIGTRLGRVPSMFGNYFVNTNPGDTEAIRAPLVMNLDIDDDGDTVIDFSLTETIPVSGAPDIFFRQNGNLVASFNSGYTFVRYFWDGHDTNTDPQSPVDGVWEPCPVVGTPDEEDCNRDTSGNFCGMGCVIPGESDVWLKVRRVTVTLANAINPFEFPFGDLLGTPLAYTVPDAANHATVSGDYNNSTGYLSMTWVQDDDFKSSFTEFPAGNNGTFAFNVGVDTLTVTLDFYPSLPPWATAANDGWHDTIQFVYAQGFQPGGAADCVPGSDCIEVQNFVGIDDDKVAVLTLAGEHDLVDDDADGYLDELDDIFDSENDDADDRFDFRAAGGNDRILVIRGR